MTSSALRLGGSWSRLILTVTALMSGITTQATAQTPLPERLLGPADLERAGLKGAVRPSAEMYDPATGLHFVRGPDSTLVLAVTPLNDVRSAGEFRTALQLVSQDLTAVSGVGDEAYLGLGGWMLAFRKGTKAVQLLTSLDIANGAKVFLTPAQLTELARTVAGRL